MGADGEVKVRGADGKEENYQGADRNLLTVREEGDGSITTARLTRELGPGSKCGDGQTE